MRTCGCETLIVTESNADLILAVRVLEALSQAPIPEAGLRRMDPSQEHPPIERVHLKTNPPSVNDSPPER